jgi:hypothetical protein
MDEHSKDTLTGAGMGAVLGGVIGGPPGAAVGGVLGGVFGSHEEKHNALLRETHDILGDATTDTAKLYVDHIDPTGAQPGNTQNVLDGINGKPDLIVTDPGNMNFIVEVETWDGIQDDPQHALKQLEDFRKPGYRRVLVAPENELESVAEWVETRIEEGRINGSEPTIASPQRLTEL